MLYEASFADGRGSVRGREYAADELDAARALFARFPKAQTATICNAYVDDKTGERRGNGNNMRWIHRRDLINGRFA